MRKHSGLLIVILVTLLSGCSLTDRYQLNKEVLSNGLTTTVIQNKNGHSSNEVDLRLLIKAGSLQETDDELGYAHFVEHMAFNGTRDFPKNKLIESLTQLGIRFGSHANAKTTFDHTEFRIKLDTNDPERLAKAIGILKQWAALIAFKPEEVEAEIPVVIQEWKLREPTLGRASYKLRQAIYKGSRFANRYPIGTVDSIQAATSERLRAFYERWYHPANTHLIVSGDIEVNVVKQLISNEFSDWKESPNATPPIVSDLNLDAVPDHTSFTDTNMLGSEVSLAFASTKSRPQNLAQREQDLQWQLGLNILGKRIQKRLIMSQGKIVQAYTHDSKPSPNIQHIGLTTILSKDDYEAGLALLSSELAHIKKNGITQQELDDLRNAALKHESAQQDSSSHLASVAVDNALYGQPIIDQPTWYKALKTSLPELTTQQVSTALNTVLSSKPHIIVSHNDKLPAPDMSLLKKALSNPKRVEAVSAGTSSGDPWQIHPETKGSITNESKHRTGADQWQFSNDITVFYKYNDSAPGKVYFELSAKGGLNLFERAEAFQARLALPVMQISGLRQMDAQTLNQWITAKGMLLYPKMGFLHRGFFGHAPSDDFPDLMKILHVALTEARISDEARTHIFQQNKTLIEQLQKQVTYKGQQQIERELFLSDPALRSLTTKELEAISNEQMQSIYNRYFANAQQYRLAIVGDISAADAKAAVLTTLANLPRNHTATKARSLPVPTKPVNFEFTGNGQRNAGISLKWFLPKTSTEKYSFDELQVLAQLVQEELFTKIREELGLVYSLNATSNGNAYNSSAWELAVDLSADVEKRQEVIKAVQDALSVMAKGEIPQSKIDDAVTAMKDDRRQRFKGAKLQATLLALNNIYAGTDKPHALDLEKRFQNITSKSLGELLKLFMSDQSTPVVISSLP